MVRPRNNEVVGNPANANGTKGKTVNTMAVKNATPGDHKRIFHNNASGTHESSQYHGVEGLTNHSRKNSPAPHQQKM